MKDWAVQSPWDALCGDPDKPARLVHPQTFVPYFHQLPPVPGPYMIFAQEIMTINVTGSMRVSVTVTVHTP